MGLQDVHEFELSIVPVDTSFMIVDVEKSIQIDRHRR